jgi:hypothetical protein
LGDAAANQVGSIQTRLGADPRVADFTSDRPPSAARRLDVPCAYHDLCDGEEVRSAIH